MKSGKLNNFPLDVSLSNLLLLTPIFPSELEDQPNLEIAEEENGFRIKNGPERRSDLSIRKPDKKGKGEVRRMFCSVIMKFACEPLLDVLMCTTGYITRFEICLLKHKRLICCNNVELRRGRGKHPHLTPNSEIFCQHHFLLGFGNNLIDRETNLKMTR